MKLIDISTHKNPNTFTMVDDSDFDWLNRWKWRSHTRSGRTTINPYAARFISNNGNSKCFLMHREIMKTSPGMVVDHKDGDTLNNQRSNLRNCTPFENARNASKRSQASSKYKGVRFNERHGKFDARIQADKKSYFLGCFKNEVDAAMAYDDGAIKYHGEFAFLNFPNKVVTA